MSYHWFSGASVERLRNELVAAGSPLPRLEVYQNGDNMTFKVVPNGGNSAGVTPINDSHVCPPTCP